MLYIMRQLKLYSKRVNPSKFINAEQVKSKYM